MKIIKNNANLQDMVEKEKEIKPKFPMKLTCSECGSEFEVDEDDVEVGVMGLYELKNGCPCCGEEVEIDDGIDLTSDMLRFPQHYYSFENGVNLSDEEIDKYVKGRIEALRNSDDKTFYSTCTGSGNSFIIVSRYDDDENFCVDVCKGYYEVNIPYTEEDKRKWCE